MAFKSKQISSAVSLPRPELRNLQTLKPYQHNARTHSKRQIEQIARSIERFGFINPVLIDASGAIIAGHGRVEAARQLSLSHVPTLRIEHLTDAEKRAYILADNKLAEKAGWDREILAIELQALVDMDFEIELTGFEMADVDFLLDEATEIKQAPLTTATDNREPTSICARRLNMVPPMRPSGTRETAALKLQVSSFREDREAPCRPAGREEPLRAMRTEDRLPRWAPGSRRKRRAVRFRVTPRESSARYRDGSGKTL
jgi:hypothetical protein